MTAICSLIILTIVVTTARSDNNADVLRYTLPLKSYYKNIPILEDLNKKFDDIDIMIPIFENIYKSNSDFGFETLLSLGNNIVDLDNRLIYYKKILSIVEEDNSLDVYKLIELIKYLKVILPDISMHTEISAVILLGNLTDKLESIGVAHLEELFSKYLNNTPDPYYYNTSVILEEIYKFDGELGLYIFSKFVRKSLNKENVFKLFYFTNMYRNLDLRINGNYELIDALVSKLEDEVPQIIYLWYKYGNNTDNVIHLLNIVNITKQIINLDKNNDLPFSVKYKLKYILVPELFDKILPIIPKCLRNIVLSDVVSIRNVGTGKYLLSSDVGNVEKQLEFGNEKLKCWNFALYSYTSFYVKFENQGKQSNLYISSEVYKENYLYVVTRSDWRSTFSFIPIPGSDHCLIGYGWLLTVLKDSKNPHFSTAVPVVTMIDNDRNGIYTDYSKWDIE